MQEPAMDAENPTPHTKRHYSREGEIPDANGRHKRYRSGSGISRKFPFAKPEWTVFRLLCPGSKTGSIIGKGGSIIKSIKRDTGAIIKVEQAVPGVEERVVTISAKDVRFGKDKTGEEEDHNKGGVTQDVDEGQDDGDRTEEAVEEFKMESDEEAKLPQMGSAGEAKRADVSPAQEALFRVHSRIFESEPSQEQDTEENDSSTKISTRLLVPTSQVGCLLGKRGKIIEKMRQESGARIRVLPRDQLPGCALPSDEVVQINGDLVAVRKALHAVSSQLRDNPPKDRDQGFGYNLPIGSAVMSLADPFLLKRNVFSQGNPLGSHFSPPRSDVVGGSQHSLSHASVPFLPDHGPQMTDLPPSVEMEVRFRILCPKERIGSIIGKGGMIVRHLREETGARIHIEDAASDVDERVVFISAVEYVNDNISKAQEAALHVQSRITDVGPDKGTTVTTRLLVSSDQIGCLIGKGGSIIAEMRKVTRANIRIYGKEHLPSCASESDELVQVMGDIRVSQEALIQITSRLRNNIIREKLGLRFGENKFAPPPGAMLQGGGPITSGGPVAAMFGRLDESLSPGRMYPSLPDAGQRSNVPRNLSPVTWGPQGVSAKQSHLAVQMQREIAGEKTRPTAMPVITSTIVEVVVPEHVMSSIIGPSGNNLAQICEISGADVHVHDLLPGATERTVEISGTPDQTHAAQSLLQAFILSGQ
eukprot:c28578_g1_i1 orf=427-2535(+)